MSVIAVDVDDVVLNLVEEWIDLYNLEHNDSLKESDVLTWDISSYTKIGRLMYKYLVPQIYDKITPIDGALSCIESLRSDGNRIIFVTSFSPDIAGVKYKWLLNNSFIKDKSDYIEAQDKSVIRCDYLIDDNPINIINTSGVGIVYDRPWNALLEDCHPRVYNWKNVEQYFKEKD